MAPGFAIADGYMAYLNLYDKQIYVVGKGPSAPQFLHHQRFRRMATV